MVGTLHGATVPCTRYDAKTGGHAWPGLRLESTADTSTEYLHQQPAPQASKHRLQPELLVAVRTV
ncbi:hypothetical protein M419DRAFT_122805 [Trichoderma reesei RUT C-30]|uniref:Uncharacterized protein n=1 Tax=Hypocrea jecorina (strain ATCC 56765 / BCRC 32924 / NRRL 11460 / Rut C-30) TaxID=1344414 RepID=A0A024SE06_HYPJR|nr:hypothetical protein M419DRAFT_122805 [Trichoderma reesei RUT C-30]